MRQACTVLCITEQAAPQPAQQPFVSELPPRPVAPAAHAAERRGVRGARRQGLLQQVPVMADFANTSKHVSIHADSPYIHSHVASNYTDSHDKEATTRAANLAALSTVTAAGDASECGARVTPSGTRRTERGRQLGWLRRTPHSAAASAAPPAG